MSGMDAAGRKPRTGGRFRFPTAILHYVGAVVGLVYPALAWASFNLGDFTLAAQMLFFVITMASCIGATALGILIADRLRKAGCGRRRTPLSFVP